MYSLIFKPILIVCLILSFFFPQIASYIFVGISWLLVSWCYFSMNAVKKVQINIEFQNDDEKRILNKYKFFFIYPFVSRDLSGVLSFISLLCFLLVPWLLFKQVFVSVVLLVVYYLVSGPLSAKLNPIQSLHYAIDTLNDPRDFIELDAANSIISKLYPVSND